MKRALLVFVGVMLTATVAQAMPASYWVEEFESYADQAAFQTAWPSWDSGNASLTFFQNWGYPATGGMGNGQSVSVGSFTTTTTNRRNIHLLPQIATPTDANPITFQYRLFDPGTGSGNTARNYCEFRGYKAGGVDSPEPWFPALYSGTDMYSCIQYGAYSATSNAKYCYRVAASTGVTFDASTPKPSSFTAGNISRLSTPAWRTFTVRIGTSFLNFYVDGVLDKHFITSGAWTPFDGVVMGSGLGTNTAAKYDSFLVTPEPMTLALLGFGSLLLRRRRVA